METSRRIRRGRKGRGRGKNAVLLERGGKGVRKKRKRARGGANQRSDSVPRRTELKTPLCIAKLREEKVKIKREGAWESDIHEQSNRSKLREASFGIPE